MAMNQYEPGVFNNFGGNRGIGFNRATWQAGNAIGRAARPFVRRARSAINSFTSRMSSRSSAQSSRRAKLIQAKRAKLAMKGVQQEVGGGSGESKSYFTLLKPKARISATKLLGKSSIVRSGAASITSTQGTQACSLLNGAFTGGDLINVYTSIGQTSSAANAAKVLLLNYHSKAEIVNAETTHAHFTIYDVVARLDFSTNNSDPATVFTVGLLDASGGASANYAVPGASPYSNPRFVSCYKILKQTDIALAPGQLHTHNIHYRPNTVYNHERDITTGATGMNPVAGLSVYSFLVFRGTPVHDDTTETSVTIGVSKLDYAIFETIEFQNMLQNYPSNSITTTLVANLTAFQMAENTPADIADSS